MAPSYPNTLKVQAVEWYISTESVSKFSADCEGIILNSLNTEKDQTIKAFSNDITTLESIEMLMTEGNKNLEARKLLEQHKTLNVFVRLLCALLSCLPVDFLRSSIYPRQVLYAF